MQREILHKIMGNDDDINVDMEFQNPLLIS